MALLEKGKKTNLQAVSDHESKVKAAYSHGLEEIYAIHTIDVKTVRRFACSKPEEMKKSPHPDKLPILQDSALEFDFGVKHRLWIEPFFLRESIVSLELPKRIETFLLESGHCLLKDIIGNDLSLSGLGQAHLDELQNSLSAYIGKRSSSRSESIDFSSWISFLTAGLEKQKCVKVFEQYGLAHLFKLSPSERFELNRCDAESALRWKNELITALKEEERAKDFHTCMRSATYAFVIPWMRGRLGVASEKEIRERIMRVSDDPQEATNTIEFFGEVYFQNRFPFCEQLYLADDDVYCADEAVKANASLILNAVKTYFYSHNVSYQMNELVSFISREFAKKWMGFPEGFIEAVLRRSKRFRVRKGFSNQLEVRLG